MRPASVGFQCPECVKEGSKQTRSGRTPYGGNVAANPRLVTISLIVVNAVVWLGAVAAGGNSGTLVQRLALLPQTTAYGTAGGIQVVEGVSGGAYYQLVTSMFTHVALTHIGFNMLALYFLGPQMEQVLGRARFLALYLVSGLVGSMTVMWLAGAHTQTLGASGAIFGLLGGLLVIALKVGSDVRQILIWIGLNAVITLSVRGISWQGHLGGLVGGVLIALVIVYAPRNAKRALLQWSGIGAILLVTLALVAARVAVLA